jgi:hypothetical protein
MLVPVTDTTRDMIHQVNNLLAVIYAQVASARSAGDVRSAFTALEFIELTAQRVMPVVKKAAMLDRDRQVSERG